MRIIRHVIVGLLLLGGAGTAGAQQAPLPTNPHGPLRPGVDCADCHTSADWKTLRPDPTFDHGQVSRFALTGQHATVRCASCHLDLRFDEPKAGPTECATCHVDVHRSNLGTDCTRCHNTTDFRDVETFSLHQRTAFPLTGAHVQTPCEACHKTERNGVFAAVPRDCVACHTASLERAAASGVDHSGFPRDCAQCHATLTWSGGAVFDHVTVSGGYVLEGAHARGRCASCHITPGFALRFAPPPTSNQDCVSCHLPDYQRQHGNQGYPTTCTDCHNVNSWDADFDHTRVARGFALQGAHVSEPCASCHVQPGNALRFSPAPTGNSDCVSCHLPDWTREHSTDQFPKTCTSCHTQSNWNSTFNHDATEFPINSGKHRGKWTSCATCHTTPSDYKAFTCLTCHEHNKTDMDDKHRGRSGYSYDSARCYSCHERGSA